MSASTADEADSPSVLIRLTGADRTGLQVETHIADDVYGPDTHDSLPRDVLRAQADFLRGPHTNMGHRPTEADRARREAGPADLGRALRALCLPGESGRAAAALIDGCPVGTMVEVCIEADRPELLGLPFEALRLPDDRLLATLPPVVMFRRPSGLAARPRKPLAGPLKILVAVGAPDEENTSAAVLDLERELQGILAAVEPANRRREAEVRILEVGHP